MVVLILVIDDLNDIRIANEKYFKTVYERVFAQSFVLKIMKNRNIFHEKEPEVKVNILTRIRIMMKKLNNFDKHLGVVGFLPQQIIKMEKRRKEIETKTMKKKSDNKRMNKLS